MPPGVAELLADGGPCALTHECLFAGYGLDRGLGSPPDGGPPHTPRFGESHASGPSQACRMT